MEVFHCSGTVFDNQDSRQSRQFVLAIRVIFTGILLLMNNYLGINCPKVSENVNLFEKLRVRLVDRARNGNVVGDNFIRMGQCLTKHLAFSMGFRMTVSSVIAVSRISVGREIKRVLKMKVSGVKKIFNHIDPLFLYIIIAYGISQLYQFVYREESVWQAFWDKIRLRLGNYLSWFCYVFFVVWPRLIFCVVKVTTPWTITSSCWMGTQMHCTGHSVWLWSRWNTSTNQKNFISIRSNRTTVRWMTCRSWEMLVKVKFYLSEFQRKTFFRQLLWWFWINSLD